MELEQLRQLVEIEKQGTISGAAEHLHITQPSLSRSMKRLEADLGQELFTRSRNSARLNEAGRLAVEHARDILAAEVRMRDAFDALARKQRTLRVGSVAPAPTWNLTARIVERFPGTILEPDMLDADTIQRGLFDRTLDLGILQHPLALPNLSCVPLMTEELSISMPKNHKLAKRKHVSFAELDGETFLMYEQVGFWRSMVEQAMPNATFIIQKDREVYAQLLATSDILSFATDAPQNRDLTPNRATVPIRDAQAHATFYLVTMADAPTRVQEIATWIRD